MENKSHALAAGAFVLLVTALLVALALWLNRDTALRTPYEISTREAVSGLQVQAAVRFRGIPVGKVTAIGFDPKIPGNVLIRISVDDATPLTESSYATLGFQGVTGLSFVQLDDTGTSSAELLAADGGAARIPLRPGLLTKLTDQGASAMAQFEETTRRVNALLAPAQQKILMTTLSNLGQAAAAIGQTAQRLDQTLQAQLGSERTDVPQLVAQATSSLKSVQILAQELTHTAQAGSQAAAQIAQVAQRLNQAGGSLDQLDQGVQSLSSVALNLNTHTLPAVADAARQTQRVMGKLADNPQALLYGDGQRAPGPGEPGFVAPEVKK